MLICILTDLLSSKYHIPFIVKTNQNCLDLTLLPIPDNCAYITLNLKLTYKAWIHFTWQKKCIGFKNSFFKLHILEQCLMYAPESLLNMNARRSGYLDRYHLLTWIVCYVYSASDSIPKYSCSKGMGN